MCSSVARRYDAEGVPLEDRKDRFLQPIDAIEIVSRAATPGTTFTPEAIEAARLRIAAGEDPTAVAQDLAIQEVWLTQDSDSD